MCSLYLYCTQRTAQNSRSLWNSFVLPHVICSIYTTITTQRDLLTHSTLHVSSKNVRQSVLQVRLIRSSLFRRQIPVHHEKSLRILPLLNLPLSNYFQFASHSMSPTMLLIDFAHNQFENRKFYFSLHTYFLPDNIAWLVRYSKSGFSSLIKPIFS